MPVLALEGCPDGNGEHGDPVGGNPVPDTTARPRPLVLTRLEAESIRLKIPSYPYHP